MMQKEKILIVDDDIEIRKIVSIYLKNEGYEIIDASDAIEALETLRNTTIDLIILDIMLPKMDGIEACLKIREQYQMPIIFLSAKDEDIDKIQGLMSGAEDYITKPFNPLELMARIKSQLRRYRVYQTEEVKQFIHEIGHLKVDEETRQVFIRNEEVRLTPKEFDILSLLVRNKGKVFSVEKIYEMVWEDSFYKSDNTVMVHITKIREKIEENPRQPVYLKTVWGVGYRV
ncbi:response regulator transcription factor [Bacillus cereus]|uniref:DNA-binding response regulator n=9 Tax=Bacillaceae TaxID=186817 RepID=A0A9X7CV20_BACCE|nr:MULTISPECIES: response regulator transcription factor [Bacillus]ANN33008.1 DNA-binding response regulator [Bacillus thuringiensis serovar coreanensis]MCU7390397.1 response regulator transcription factor [Bacillus sp. ST24]TBL05879.1 response regulator transcription factor [Bacillus paranthracis]AKR36126.1 Regulatory protein VanR [Bacillus thuringiensis serovar indiana]ANE86285.1 DNA-binding response regulator [Bacillus cereus]